AVFALRHVHALAHGNTWRLCGACARCGAALFGRAFAQDLVDKALDHANSLRMRQPRSRATSSSEGLGLLATGSLARSSRGRSLGESLYKLTRSKSLNCRPRPASHCSTRAILPSRNDGTPSISPVARPPESRTRRT